jgi:hypothetical protein
LLRGFSSFELHSRSHCKKTCTKPKEAQSGLVFQLNLWVKTAEFV